MEEKILKQSYIKTPVGKMVVLVDDTAMYLLEFVFRKGLEAEIARLLKKTKRTLSAGRTSITDLIEQEVQSYFAGKLQKFVTPIVLVGSSFQQFVWNGLRAIPFGTTFSYKEMARSLGRPTAYRGVARANATNHLALVIPCHRVIASSGRLGGYAGGVECKEWLLAHEARVVKKTLD